MTKIYQYPYIVFKNRSIIFRNRATSGNSEAGEARLFFDTSDNKLKLSQNDRDNLYSKKVNPIATLNNIPVVYGQKTLQTEASALDRVNVRRLLVALKSYISQVANNLVFEQNTLATRSSFLAAVNPYLDGVQRRQGLYAFQVVSEGILDKVSVCVKPSTSFTLKKFEFV